MLARSAQGLYWMSRYLERAEQLARMLRMQTEALVDRPVREIHFGWTRMYGCLGRQPPWGELEMLDDDDFTLADSYTLADDLTFERANPCSVWTCFALGRENARQMRQCISAEMWTGLNLAYLIIQRSTIEDIWILSPERFYAQTATSINTFAGVAAATMYRGEGWNFMQLEHYVERAQSLSNLLLAQIAAADSIDDSSEADWTSLLRLQHAFEAYSRRYSVRIDPGQVLDLLTTDPLLPGSLRRSLDGIASQIRAIGPGPDAKTSAAARRLAAELKVRSAAEWTPGGDRKDQLQKVSQQCRDLHNLVTQCYFDYLVDDDPRP